MNTSYDKNAALVVLPPVRGGRLQDRSLQTWLSQADLGYAPSRVESLDQIAGALGLPIPSDGRAALRMWGQTGDRPTKWIAAADPVYLEPRLDHLCLHALRRSDISSKDFRALIDYLQARLAGEDQFGFTRLGPHGYLSSPQPVATAALSAEVVDCDNPDEYLPDGDDAAGFRNLVSEIEMALHDHEINLDRETKGQRPVNSLWLWGGGFAPEQVTRAQPPLFSDDALSTGYWYSATAVAEPWLGSIEACLEASLAGFVAEVPRDTDIRAVEQILFELRAALRAGRLSSLILLFRDGMRAHILRSHGLRIWRRVSPLLIDEDRA